RSAPASRTASTSSPRRAKSADRIDGAISGSSDASTFIVCSRVRLGPGLRGNRAIISRSPFRLILHGHIARGLRPRLERECQRKRGDQHGRERPQRRRVAGPRGACRLRYTADRRSAEKLPGAKAERQQALPRAPPRLARLLQHHVAKRRAEQRGEPEADETCGRVELCEA